MNCPFCFLPISVTSKSHFTKCKIKPHYRIVHKGNPNCSHEYVNITYNSTLKNGEKQRIVLTLRCVTCELHLLFDSFESIWLPNLKEIIKN